MAIFDFFSNSNAVALTADACRERTITDVARAYRALLRARRERDFGDTGRPRTAKAQATLDPRVDRACDALARSVGRLATAKPELARIIRQTLLADGAGQYQELLALATTDIGRRAVRDIRASLTRAAKRTGAS